LILLERKKMMYNKRMEKERFIVHVDMDAFYASVEQRDFPEYRGKPVVVGADPQGGQGRGVVAACSYEAREFGIHSAMPISMAYKRCPHAIYLRGDMKKYVRISRQIFGILEQFTPDIEPISIDEAFLDITGSYKLFGTTEETCRKIKAAIYNETGLKASLGMAPNKMTAKIASDLEKPDGLVIVTREGLLDFLHPLEVSKLWGVGKRTKDELTRLGIKTVGDLASRQLKELSDLLGKGGVHVWKLANGIDPRDVETQVGIKSIGHEHTFTEDVTDLQKIEDTLMWLAEKVSRRLRKKGLRGRTISLKIRLADFSTFTRAKSLHTPTNFVTDLFQTALEKAKGFKLGEQPIRLIGIQVSNLEAETDQLGLFGLTSPGSEKKEKLHEAVDQIKDKFGERAIKHRK
jgi:nucleotidyltransferase/DNA polymerase involved in DNA repair